MSDPELSWRLRDYYELVNTLNERVNGQPVGNHPNSFYLTNLPATVYVKFYRPAEWIPTTFPLLL